MTRNGKRVIIGVYPDHARASQVIDQLRLAGFGEDQIDVASENEEERLSGIIVVEKNCGFSRTGVIGTIVGAGLGSLWGVGVAIAALPAVGPVLAGGGLASIIVGAAEGTAVGGVIGALIGSGIRSTDSTVAYARLLDGGTTVVVSPGSRHDEAAEILKEQVEAAQQQHYRRIRALGK